MTTNARHSFRKQHVQRLSTLLKNTLACGAADAMPVPDPLFEQRKQRLYPADLAKTKLDLKVLKCLTRDTAKATALRKELVGNTQVRDAWQRAVDDLCPDKLRAMLLLLDERDIVTELARPLFNSPLQQVRAIPQLDDAGRTSAGKQYPYFSTKWQKGGGPMPPRHFNVDPIVCRHLAMHHLLQMAADPETIKCPLHVEFGSLEAIRNKVSEHGMNRRFAMLCKRASTTHLVSNARFGQFLAAQFRDMASTGKPTRLMLLTTTNHAMSVGLRIKQEGNQPVYVVKLFDPNRTTHHARNRTSNLATLAGMALSDWLDSDRAHAKYYPETNAISAFFVLDTQDVIDHDTVPAPAPGRTLTSIDCSPPADATVMHFLLRHGFTGNLAELEAHFAALPDAEKIIALAAKSGDGVPGLYFALQNGHAATMPILARLLAHIPEEARALLLAAFNASKTPGLFHAFINGHADLLRAYCAPLQLVPETHRAFLLAARNAHHTSGLSRAFSKGHAQTIRAFSAPLALVPPDQRASLAAAKNSSGEPGVLVALRKKHAEAIRAFRILLELVPLEQRADLLPHVDHGAQPGGSAAPVSERQLAIDAYEELRRWNSGEGQ